MVEAVVFEVLEEHILDKGIGRCRCGAELANKGHRTREWRRHVAAEIARAVGGGQP